MYTSSFDIYSKVQTIEVKPNEIEGEFDGLNSFIAIFLYFTYRFPNEETILDIISASAKLKLQSPAVELSECNVQIGLTIPRKEYDQGEWFRFKVSKEALRIVENRRKGDLSLHIELFVTCATKKLVNSLQGKVIAIPDRMHKEKSDLHFTIPRSVWIESILNNTGFQTLRLFEIPVDHKLIKEVYKDIIFEFDQAEEYYIKQDYNKCIAHCRNVLDALHRNLKKLKAGIESETAFQWLKTIDNSTIDWIDSMDKANSSISSKAHHSGHKEQFSRQQAEAVYLTVLGLINYVGHIKQ